MHSILLAILKLNFWKSFGAGEYIQATHSRNVFPFSEKKLGHDKCIQYQGSYLKYLHPFGRTAGKNRCART